MSPFGPYYTTLFPSLPTSQITTLSCGHVIPSSNLLAWTLSRGPAGKEFNFTFSNRGNNEMIDELGRALLNICTIVPDGLVVFFPSYAYLSTILARWSSSASPTQPSILSRLEGKKSLFKESKDVSVETVLMDYAKAIDSGKGGLLLSVVGGKMSEGINFSDSLGRCVLIVGLPYPNINSAEWKAKIEYIENSTRERLGEEKEKGWGRQRWRGGRRRRGGNIMRILVCGRLIRVLGGRSGIRGIMRLLLWWMGGLRGRGLGGSCRGGLERGWWRVLGRRSLGS